MKSDYASVDALALGMRTVLGDLAASSTDGGTDAVAEARSPALSFLRWSRPPLPVEGVKDVEIGGPRRPLRMRIYWPAASPALLMLYLHGGAWVGGSVELADRICRRLCRQSQRLVASLDYGLAPEEPYPAAVDDCVAAWYWLHTNASIIGANVENALVVGESAGANLAAALCLRLRNAERDGVARQLLICPVLDDSSDTESHRKWGGGDYLVSSAALADSWRTYLGGQAIDGFAAPLRATDLRGLPPATIVVAGCDPLRDDGVAYAERLTAVGIPVDLISAPGLLHAFIYMDGVSAKAAEVVDRIGRLAA